MGKAHNGVVATPGVPGGAGLLSVVVPVYNEQETIDALLRRLRTLGLPNKEVIIVDDGSTDNTPAILQRWRTEPGFTVLRHPHNRGKGTAIRTALPHVRGDVTVVQDADLEYDPADLPKLAEVIRRGESSVAYGSRYLAVTGNLPWTRYRLAVLLLNALVRVLYGRRITDEATCYKAFRTEFLRALDVRAERFEFCAEVTAKVCRLGCPIAEIAVSYRPRSRQGGKKIGWLDIVPTVWTLVKWRFLRMPQADRATSDPRLARHPA